MKKDGFTLIELMIVVVIIGILASIAIPTFLRYQMKARSAEVPRNLGAIRTSEETFMAKWAVYSYASKRPATGGLSSRVVWGTIAAPGDGFDTIGFAPNGSLYYAYSVAQGPPVTATGVISPAANTLVLAGGVVSNGSGNTAIVSDIYMQASANLDKTGDFGSFYSTEEDGSLVPVPGNAGEATF